MKPDTGGPFTLPHFATWASGLVLDNHKPWVLEDFQRWFIEDLFTGAPENWFILPEGNGKTTLIAGVVLYHIEFKPEAWVPVGASARDQAEILYRQAAGFALRSPSLRGKFRCYDGYRRIVFGADDKDALAPKIQVFAADEKTGDGVIPTLAVVDEPHRLAHMGLYRTWSGKLDKRPGAQIVAISVAGEPGSEFEAAREAFRKAAKPVERTKTFLRIRTPDFVYHEWSVPAKGNVDDFELVKQANPFSGITVEKLAKKRARPTMTLGHWKRMTCNLPDRSEDSAITEQEWAAAETSTEIPAGERVWAGLDIAWKIDTTALVPLWAPREDYRVFGPARVLTPPRDGGMVSVYDVKSAIRELHERNPIIALVMDTHKAEDIYTWAKDELGLNVVDRGQSNALAAMDYERFMEALRNGWLKHLGDADLTAHVLNAIAVRLDNGKARFERPSQSRRNVREQARRVIDALTAASMANTTAAADLAAGQSWGMA